MRIGGGAHNKRDLNNLYQVIYYGDSQVEVGKPFSISCIISIANPVEWHKDGEPIRKHSNIRHGKDEHSYIESEMGIAGNRDKIEASISVQRALPKHQGKYQCNPLYKNYHQLYVYRNGTLLGHPGGSVAAVVVPGTEKQHRDELQLTLLSTVKSTLVAPLSVEHHHFTTAVALAPGPPVLDDEFPREHERERESPKASGHSPHHHSRQQAGAMGHRHHTGNGSGAPEKKLSSQQGKDDSKWFVSQKTTTANAEELLEQTVEGLEDFAPVLHSTDRGSVAMGKAPKHSTGTGRVQAPPPLLETHEDDDEEEDIGVDVDVVREGEAREIVNQDTGVDNVEDLVEPDTEIVIESKAISLEDENIDRLIQNKSDINGIILVDSLEELSLHKPAQAATDDHSSAMKNVSDGFPVFAIASSITPAGATSGQQAVTKEGDSGATIAPPPDHHHHHHHHEHHATTTTQTPAVTTSTSTTTTTTIATTSTTTSTTTTTVAPPPLTTIKAA
uniref:Ig-like domain-containing protein n=1 Tax=Anopheles epiroticus TaxID=199890 RepID=A0A182PLT6_9DIPT